MFKDGIRQNIGDEDRLPTVYCCAARSALWANSESVQRRDVGFRKSRRSNSPHVYLVVVEKPNSTKHPFVFALSLNNTRHTRQHLLQRSPCEDHSQYFENDLTRETFRQRYAIWLLIGRARRGLKVHGAMTCGRHLRAL